MGCRGRVECGTSTLIRRGVESVPKRVLARKVPADGRGFAPPNVSHKLLVLDDDANCCTVGGAQPLANDNVLNLCVQIRSVGEC